MKRVPRNGTFEPNQIGPRNLGPLLTKRSQHAFEGKISRGFLQSLNSVTTRGVRLQICGSFPANFLPNARGARWPAPIIGRDDVRYTSPWTQGREASHIRIKFSGQRSKRVPIIPPKKGLRSITNRVLDEISNEISQPEDFSPTPRAATWSF